MLFKEIRTVAALRPLGGLRDLAFFLDVDGTLVDLAPTPDSVRVAPETLDLLRRLVICTEGAVALVSGRAISVLDDLFRPLWLPAAGLHGFERRNVCGAYSKHGAPDGVSLQRARILLSEFVRRHPGLLLEDKRFAIAVHYRAAPQLADDVKDAVNAVQRVVGSAFEVQPGQMVMELRPSGANKAGAIASFMREPPFQRRHAVMVGDDLTDECAFRWVNAAGGSSIAVNVSHPTSATARLDGVRDVHGWLWRLLAEHCS